MTTPDKEKLLELAERVEKATGPDRDMDKAIALAQPERFFNAGPYYAGAPDRIGEINEDGSRSIPGNAPDMLVPRYTASIDAAITLLPEGDGVGWRMTDGAGGPTAEIWNFDFDSGKVLFEVGANPAATPALALCAAALRARASHPGDQS